MQKPHPVRFASDIILLSVPAIILARAIDGQQVNVWTRLVLNVLVALVVTFLFPDYIVDHLLNRTFPGTMAITVFLSAQTWN